MDDYAREISDLKAEIEQMKEAEEDPDEILELELQLEILTELYARARQLLEDGQNDDRLRQALKVKGYGDWNLENVYAFIYEQAVDLPGSGHHAFVGGIRESDFGTLLKEPAEP
ncbi:MAG TPA: hypothetical protein VF137_03475 [Candidatus Dormibacteraeota bacterium]